MIQQNLKTQSQKQFSIFFLIVSLCVFIIVALRSYFVPFNHDETATFFMYVQSGKYMPFYSQVDANNHVLNSFLSNISFHLFGTSPLALRLPNLLGFVILILATHKILKRLQQISTKVFLTAAVLLSFHWLSFFSVCRGYGLSMALLLMAVTFMLDYIDFNEKKSSFLLSLLFFQLAISSNLILIIVVLLLSGIIIVTQFSNKQLFKFPVIASWLIHFLAIYYWLSFSFYLQNNGALYYGAGDSYWKVTFVSLIELLLGFYTIWLKYVLLALFLIIVILTVYFNRHLISSIKSQFKKPESTIVFGFITISLCLGFYLMHQLLNVNYPEDRTGLFFYLFFILWISFVIDRFSFKFHNLLVLFISSVFVVHFLWNLNFRKHSLNVYETIPEHFYTTLMNEQSKSDERITIGGHRVRELFYAFINYRHNGFLNSADPTEVMQMNCDYYIATRNEEKYFKEYYNMIDSEPDWGFVLLKRKEKIIRNKQIEIKELNIVDNENEFIEIYSRYDTIFTNTNPLLLELNIDVNHVPVPINIPFVFQINDSLDQTVYFKRYPLQWSGYDLNGRKKLNCSIILGNLPLKAKKMVCFFWNIEQKPISIKVNTLKMYQLEGKGVDYEAPDIK